MKKLIIALALMSVCNISYANDWFVQQKPKTPEVEESVPKPELSKPTNPTPQVPPKPPQSGLQQRAGFLKAPCGTIPEMTAQIQKYTESLLFHGTGLTFSPQNVPYRGGMMFFVNQDTGSWTVLQVFQDGIACMIFNGTVFKPYDGDQPYSKEQSK